MRGCTPGRGFIQGRTEVQVAVLADSDPGVEQEALLALISAARHRWPVAVRPVRPMPGHVTVSEMPLATSSLVLPVGIGESEVVPVALDLTEAHALVSGPPRSGRSTTLAALATMAATAPGAAALVLVTARKSAELASAVPWSLGPVDAGRPEELTDALDEIRRLLEGGRTVLCFVDDADSLSDTASNALEELARRSRDEPIRVVAAADTRWALRAYGGLVPELRKAKQGVLLAPEVEMDGDLLGVRLRTPVERTVRGRPGIPGRPRNL